MANLNFLDPTTLRESGAQRTNVNGEAAALDSIRKAHRNGPLVGDPIAFAKAAKGVSASRVRDPNADDAVSKDEDEDDDMDTDGDEDMVLTADERNDLRTRRQGRKDADKKRRSNSDAALKMVKAIHGKGARPEDPDAFIKAGKTRLKYVD